MSACSIILKLKNIDFNKNILNKRKSFQILYILFKQSIINIKTR